MLERIFFKHLELYSDPSVLVLVLNTTNADQEYFLRLLREERKHTVKDASPIRHVAPKQFNANIGAEERKSVYLQGKGINIYRFRLKDLVFRVSGGIIFGTTRIFVTDVLKELIPLYLVTGILFYRAHSILRSTLESFIIRTYREAKPEGFVKAFSDNARAFAAGGIGALQRVVSALRVERIRFLPRYHADVIAELEKSKPELFEIPVQLKPTVKAMEACLLELIMACMQVCSFFLAFRVAMEHAALILGAQTLLSWNDLGRHESGKRPHSRIRKDPATSSGRRSPLPRSADTKGARSSHRH